MGDAIGTDMGPVTRGWLDRNHPAQYYIDAVYGWAPTGYRWTRDDLGDLELQRDPSAVGNERERYNRCPKCEEWSPCRVREVFEAFDGVDAPKPGWW